MNVGPRAHATIERGFVLVGVLMFVLILTILGLTLFSLSGFESQFYTNSLDQKRAFYSATGAIERAKYVLSTTGKLEDARNITGVALDGLLYTVAKQGTDFASADSSDTVQWVNNPNPPPPVWIRSLAVVGGQRSLVEAQFRPYRGPSYYKRLFTLSNNDPGRGLVVTDSLNGLKVGKQVILGGGLWQNSTNVAAFAPASFPPNPINTSGGVPAPDINAYFSKFWNAAAPAPAPLPPDNYVFDAYSQDPVGHVGFWKSPWNGSSKWSLDDNVGGGGPATIQVHGTCIWMFDHGAHWNRHVVVVRGGFPSNDDALILIAHPGSDPLEAGRGIALNQPLYSLSLPALPVYLVSDGGVGIEAIEDPLSISIVNYLSVFAVTCGLIGPSPGAAYVMALSHDPNSVQDRAITGLVDRLSKKGYLPNTSGSGDFTPIAGKWREITDSNPIN